VSTSPIKLVCFDLDRTILNGRLNHALKTAGIVPGKTDRVELDFHMENTGGIKNRRSLLKTMRDLLKHNVRIAVTSFAEHCESIPYVLERVGLNPEEIDQIKIACFRPEDAERKKFGKNNHIEQAIAMFPGENVSPNEVVLVDDNPRNLDLAKPQGYQIILVQDDEGIDYLNKLRAVSGLSPLHNFFGAPFVMPVRNHLRVPAPRAATPPRTGIDI
jgi:FMN phosphatase YigB (HAD superfamily)